MSGKACPPSAEFEDAACNLTTEHNINANISESGEKEQENEENPNISKDINFTEINDQERIVLYEKGVQFKRKQSTRHALHCLLGCLQGLKDGSKFPMLPDCLKHIADLYVEEGDYETAISFVQAEKLYYETALINVGSAAEEVLQGKPDTDEQVTVTEPDVESGNVNNKSPLPKQAEKPEKEESVSLEAAKKADEYEKLSHLCLKQKNIQLALEYCGKAVKIRQSQFGENHPITTKSLNLFTVIYAEMGKEQYSAAMKKFSELNEGTKDAMKETTPDKPHHQSEVDYHPDPSGVVGDNPDTPTSSELSKGETRKYDDNTGEKNKDQISKDSKTDEVDSSTNTGSSGLVDQTVLWFFIVSVLLGILVAVLLKYATMRDFRALYKFTVTRLKYFYYFYFKQTPGGGDKFF